MRSIFQPNNWLVGATQDVLLKMIVVFSTLRMSLIEREPFMKAKSGKIALTARALGLVAAAVVGSSALSGCEALYHQLEPFAPGDHTGHDH